MKLSTWKDSWITILSITLILLIWTILSTVLAIPIILPSPYDVIKSAFALFREENFWLALLGTVKRGVGSFIITIISGTLVGISAGYSKNIEKFFSPILIVIRATPVMSVILLAYIWLKSGEVPIFAAFLMAFPVVFQSVYQGVSNRDANLIEMGRLYGFSKTMILTHITIPSLIPYILTAAKGALGMTWKVIVAAEVISVPKYGVGTGMHSAQLELNTAAVLAWTAIAILLTAGGDAILDIIAKKSLHVKTKKKSHSMQKSSVKNG